MFKRITSKNDVMEFINYVKERGFFNTGYFFIDGKWEVVIIEFRNDTFYFSNTFKLQRTEVDEIGKFIWSNRKVINDKIFGSQSKVYRTN